MITHAQPLLDSVDLSEREPLGALEREDAHATFGARPAPVQEIRRADGHNPQAAPRR